MILIPNTQQKIERHQPIFLLAHIKHTAMELNLQKLNTALVQHDGNIWFEPQPVPDTRPAWKQYAKDNNQTLSIQVHDRVYRWHPNNHTDMLDTATQRWYFWGPKPTLKDAITKEPHSGICYIFHSDGSVTSQWAEFQLFWGRPIKTVWVEGEPTYEQFESSEGSG